LEPKLTGLTSGLTAVSDLSSDLVFELFESSQKQLSPVSGVKTPLGALCFFENSSRTKLSFERAGRELGIEWIDFQPERSSLQKGESWRESLQLLKIYGAQFLVLRHAETGFADWARQWTGLPVFNAGDGAHEHPTQALGDALTLWRQSPRSKFKIAFFGDVDRSRVARSSTQLFKMLGHQVQIVNDDTIATQNFAKAFQVDLIDRAQLKKMDVVYALRAQKERGGRSLLGPLELSELGEKTLVMHAGPVMEGEDLGFSLCDFSAARSLVHAQVKSCFDIRRSLLHRFFQDLKGART